MKMKTKKPMSILMKEFYNHGFVGTMWLIIAVSSLFSKSMFLNVVLSLLLIFAVLLQIRVMFARKDAMDVMDEMAVLHETKAYARVMNVLLLVISCLGVYAVLADTWMIDMKKIFPFLLGISNILVFLHFLILEKVGD